MSLPPDKLAYIPFRASMEVPRRHRPNLRVLNSMESSTSAITCDRQELGLRIDQLRERIHGQSATVRALLARTAILEARLSLYVSALI